MSRISSRLLNWYNKNKRTLPWRDHPDPYAVWVSEIMLQQTRVDTVIPFFEKWMVSFPSVRSLAEASEQDILNAWEGLGYYSRARNLHKASRIVVDDYGGVIPKDISTLLQLPGIGRYTAGAIASFAYNMDEPVLDGNIKRVYARLYDLSEEVDSLQGEKFLWDIAKNNLPNGKTADFNQALMDLGALICLPRKPHCVICPLQIECGAREHATQEYRPVKKIKKIVPHHIQTAGVILKGGRVLLTQRPSKGLLGGLWEFPNGRVKGSPARGLAGALKKGYRLKVRKKEALGMVQHAYSHFKVTVHVFQCELQEHFIENMEWVEIKNLGDYPMGKVDRQIAGMIELSNRT